jgi:YggT family protein
MITILFNLAIWVLNLYKWAVIIAAILSLLTSFGVLDTRNRIVWTINDFFYRITEPALRPIRNILPGFGGIDLSPWALVILLIVAEEVLMRVEQAIIFGTLRPLLI